MSLGLQIPVSEQFHAYCDQAMLRLGYLYPDLDFSFSGSAICVSGGETQSISNLSREVKFALYREKIYQESLPLRERMYQALFD